MLSNEDYKNIFHEIKNSITLISSYLQLLVKMHPEIANLEYWTSSQAEIMRLRTIVTELSQTKLGSNLQTKCLDLRDFIKDCCTNLHFFNGKEAISCVVSLTEQPCLADIDSLQLRHAIINLIKNSCEAMQYQGCIQVALSQEKNTVCIHITDLGGGIAPELLDNIFDPFFTTKADGSGLGLSIAKQIITAHNGTICVESQEGVGCTFTISLPSAQKC